MDIVDWLRKEAEEIAESHRQALYGPGGGKPDAKREDYREWEAAEEIERLRAKIKVMGSAALNPQERRLAREALEAVMAQIGGFWNSPDRNKVVALIKKMKSTRKPT